VRIYKLICPTAVALVFALTIGAASASATSVDALSGAGSTLVAPLIAEWSQDFKVFYGITVNYNGVGSQAGLNDISNGSVNFGVTDSPLTAAEAQSCGHCLQLPWALTAIGIGYHVPGIGGKLKLSGTVLADIYRGQITHWNDPKIKSLNPTLNLPSLKITPIYANASGDTYAFTKFLSSVNSSWASSIGYGNTVNFPTGITGNGNSGVTTLLGNTNGAIAYLGVAYLIAHQLPAAAVLNAAGRYEYPNLANIAAAGNSVSHVPASNYVQIVDPPKRAKTAYPISTFSYAIVSPNASSDVRAGLKTWVLYAVGAGQTFGQALDFAPIPKVVRNADKATMRTF
jgi:phosphate transport system substrate-binding protein